MLNILKEYLCLIFSLIVLEFVFYCRDYNELKIMSIYISYDITNGNVGNFENDKYKVTINNDDSELVEYEISMKRTSLFDIKTLKTIKYIGLVN